MHTGIDDEMAGDSPRADEASGREATAADARLVELARAGDRHAWARLYQTYFDVVLRHVSYLIGDSQTAEDLTQEAFVRGFKAASRFRGDAKFHTWMTRIATNVARRHLEKRASRSRTRLGFAAVLKQQPQRLDVEQTYEDEVRAKVLYAALDTLPIPLREAFVLRDLLDLPPAEAADNLGITKGNLAVRAHRARVQLSAELARRGWGGDRE